MGGGGLGRGVVYVILDPVYLCVGVGVCFVCARVVRVCVCVLVCVLVCVRE